MAKNVQNFAKPFPKLLNSISRHFFGSVETKLPNVPQIRFGERTLNFVQRLTGGNQIMQLKQIGKAQPSN